MGGEIIFGIITVHVLAFLSASVHLPRIGHDTPAFNWYGTEKLIKKHLASKGIPTLVYPLTENYLLLVWVIMSGIKFITYFFFID